MRSFAGSLTGLNFGLLRLSSIATGGSRPPRDMPAGSMFSCPPVGNADVEAEDVARFAPPATAAVFARYPAKSSCCDDLDRSACGGPPPRGPLVCKASWGGSSGKFWDPALGLYSIGETFDVM